MDDKACDITHKQIDKKLEEHDKRLGIHGEQIDELKTGHVRTETVVEQLCDQISELVHAIAEERKVRQSENAEMHKANTKMLWAFIGGLSMVTFAFLGFIFWYIQQLPTLPS